MLPDRFQKWFAGRGWSPRAHQLALLEKARDNRSALLIAPTGAGKTLAGFLPTLVELSGDTRSRAASWPLPPYTVSSPSPLVGEGRGGGHPDAQSQLSPSRRGEGRSSVQRSRGLHTLYISPLKALAVDIARNLEMPVAEMGLPIRIETRTGDTPVSRRQRQRRYPPDILLTTPEQLALLLASDDAPFLFSSLKRIVLDELHALVTSKRGDLLSLGLARLWKLAPEIRAIGLS
ncbi:MAG: DEAD/DEAH box helicase, partial [Bradyrhizobium sp.]|nr:DEAD/DEAH box helicase [Bradyrhizobium sp.]